MDDALRTGDPDVLSAFDAEHAPALLGWLMRRTGDGELAAGCAGLLDGELVGEVSGAEVTFRPASADG